MSEQRIAAAIVTMNKRAAVLGLLARLDEEKISAFVTTNACSDGTADAVRAAFPAATVLESAHNLGGTGGFNCAMLAALAAQPRYLALIDDDALPDRGCLAQLADFLDAHPDHAFAVPAIHIASRPEWLQETGGDVRFDREVAVESWNRLRENEGLPEHFEIGYGSACTLLVRADAVQRVGVMDWNYFLFYDDVDWCLRLRDKVGKASCLTRTRSLHDFPWGKQLSLSRLYYFQRNNLLLLSRWRPEERTLRTLRMPLSRLVRDALLAAAAGDADMRDTFAAALRDAWCGRFGKWRSERSFPAGRPRVDVAGFRARGVVRVLVNIRNEQPPAELVAELRRLGGEGLVIDALCGGRQVEALRALGVFGDVVGRDLRRRAVPAQLRALRRRRYDVVVTDASMEPRSAADAVGGAAMFYHAGSLFEAAQRPVRLLIASFLAPTLGSIAAWLLAWRFASRPELGAPPAEARPLLEKLGIDPRVGHPWGRR
jgi:GT2 family glycosyltransferase